MQWQLLLVAVAAVAEGVQADDCAPPPSGAKKTHPSECCKVKNFVMTDAMTSNIKKCVEKYPLPAKPSGPPSEPNPEMKKAAVCAAECLFGESGMLTSDKKLDKAAVTKTFTSVVAGDADMMPVLNAALDKCFASYAANVDQSLECKSGAKELEMCLMREGFLNCPKSAWNGTPDCVELKAMITKCPKMPVMLMPPGHHHA